MRWILPAIIIFILSFQACNETGGSSCGCTYKTGEGLILGIDARKCMCCGGWWIEIGKDTLRIMEMPQNFQDDLADKELPVPVLLKWKQETEGCGAQFEEIIEVKSISIIN